MKKEMRVLKNYLKVARMSQAEFARKIDVNQGQLNHWIQGRREPRLTALRRISKETGISLERLIGDL